MRRIRTSKRQFFQSFFVFFIVVFCLLAGATGRNGRAQKANGRGVMDAVVSYVSK